MDQQDAVRFFLISRKADTEYTFDVDLALKKNDENPVFYVRYAHARISSVLNQWAADHGGDLASLGSADLSLLTAPAETRADGQAQRVPRDALGRRARPGAARCRVLPT